MQDQLFREQITVTYTPGMCRELGCTELVRRRQGARYCEIHARGTNGKSTGYNPLSGTQDATCSCGRDYRRPHRSIRQSDPVRAWHDFCLECRENSAITLSQLRTHRAPYDYAVLWLQQSGRLQCDLCERRVHRKQGDGRAVIDHDHRCCPHDGSCGLCIRGVLCTSCNTLVASYERLFSRFSEDKLRLYLT